MESPPPGGLPLGEGLSGTFDNLLREHHERGLLTLTKLVEAVPSPLFDSDRDPANQDWEPLAVNLGKLAEICGTETSRHLERVRRYVQVLVADLRAHDVFPEIDADWEDRVTRASPLHDLGKIAIPSGILLKPGPLSLPEREIMRLHVPLGAESLEAMRTAHPGVEFWAMARDIAASHHERWDGSGYPRGIAAEDIPLCGRVVALVDVYDALTSRRVYKSAMSHERARDYLDAQSGREFDDRIVSAFLRNDDDFRAILGRFGD